MSDEAAIRRLLVIQALEGLPPAAREAALSNAKFRRRQDLRITLEVKLGDDGPTSDRERLYDALRRVISSTSATANLLDDEDRTWTVRIRPHEEDEPVYTLEYGDRCIRIDDHSALAADGMTRIAWFNRMVAAALPPPKWSAWRGEKL